MTFLPSVESVQVPASARPLVLAPAPVGLRLSDVALVPATPTLMSPVPGSPDANPDSFPG
jgi:hypothetical protein